MQVYTTVQKNGKIFECYWKIFMNFMLTKAVFIVQKYSNTVK